MEEHGHGLWALFGSFCHTHFVLFNIKARTFTFWHCMCILYGVDVQMFNISIARERERTDNEQRPRG